MEEHEPNHGHHDPVTLTEKTEVHTNLGVILIAAAAIVTVTASALQYKHQFDTLAKADKALAEDTKTLRRDLVDHSTKSAAALATLTRKHEALDNSVVGRKPRGWHRDTMARWSAGLEEGLQRIIDRLPGDTSLTGANVVPDAWAIEWYDPQDRVWKDGRGNVVRQ